MLNKSIFLFISIIILSLQISLAQKGVLTAGFQFKPIFSSSMFGTGPIEKRIDTVLFTMKPGGGFAAGMMIRRGITNRVSAETGINYVKRNYSIKIDKEEVKATTDFSIVGYEVPLLGMVYIQLSQELFMNVALGASLDFFPSEIATKGTNFTHFSQRNHRLVPGVLANLGWEWRTEKSGYFYLGASYHRPYQHIYDTFVIYKEGVGRETPAQFKLEGTYLTVDLRYFFHEDPDSKSSKNRTD